MEISCNPAENINETPHNAICGVVDCISLLLDYSWFAFFFTSLLAGPQLTATISEAIPFSLSLTACYRKKETVCFQTQNCFSQGRWCCSKVHCSPSCHESQGGGGALYKVLSEKLCFKAKVKPVQGTNVPL